MSNDFDDNEFWARIGANQQHVRQMQYDSSEQNTVLGVFMRLLDSVTKDGGRKRAAGTKPPWYVDPSHEAAVWSHINAWKHGELKDKDSGAHPCVHAAWRLLAIAYQETHGKVEP